MATNTPSSFDNIMDSVDRSWWAWDLSSVLSSRKEDIQHHCRIWWFDYDVFKEEHEKLHSGGWDYDGSAWYMRYNALTGNSWSQLWTTMAEADLYKGSVTAIEKRIFEKYGHRLKRYYEQWGKNIIDLGVGGWWKLFDLMDIAKVDLAGKEMVWCDYSSIFLDSFNQKAKERKIPCITLAGDFSKNKIFADHEGTVTMNGWSVGNYTDYENQSLLRKIATGKSRHIVMTHFVAPSGENKDQEIKKIEEMYHTPEMKNRIMTGFDAMGIPSDKLDFHAEYIVGKDWKTDMMTIGAKVKKGESFSVHGRYHETKTYTEGDYIQAINSRRYSKQQFAEMVQWAWCKVVESFDEDGVAVSVIKTPKRSAMKYIRDSWEDLNMTAKVLLSSAIGIPVGIVANNAYTGYKANKEKQEISVQVDESIIRAKQALTTEFNYDSGNIASKVEWLKLRVQNITDYLTIHYNFAELDARWQDQIRWAWKDYVRREWDINKHYEGDELELMVKHFILTNASSLISSGLDLKPYMSLESEEDVLAATHLAIGDYEYGSYTKSMWRWASITKSFTHIAPDGSEQRFWRSEYSTEEDYRGHNEYLFSTWSLVKLTLNDTTIFLKKKANSHNEYTLKDAQRITANYFDKWYVDLLTDKIISQVDRVDKPEKMTQSQSIFQEYQEREKSKLSRPIKEVLLNLSAQWYDFSDMVYGNRWYDQLMGTYIKPALEEKWMWDTDFDEKFAWKLSKSDDYREMIWGIKRLLYQRRNSRTDYNSRDDKKLESELFYIVASSLITEYSLDTDMEKRILIEKNADLLVKYGYTITPFKEFEEMDERFEFTKTYNIKTWRSSQMGAPGILYTTLEWEVFRIAKTNQYHPSPLAAHSINENAQRSIEEKVRAPFKQHLIDQFIKNHWKENLDHVLEQRIDDQVSWTIYGTSIAIAQYVAKDYFIQKEMRQRLRNARRRR